VLEEIITHSSENTSWGGNSRAPQCPQWLCFSPVDLVTERPLFTKASFPDSAPPTEDDVTHPQPSPSVRPMGNPPRVLPRGFIAGLEHFPDFETAGMEDMFAAPSVAF